MKTTTPNPALALARSKLSSDDRRAMLRAFIRLNAAISIAASLGDSGSDTINASRALSNPDLMISVAFSVAAVIGCTEEEGNESGAIVTATVSELARLVSESPKDAKKLLDDILVSTAGSYL